MKSTCSSFLDRWSLWPIFFDVAVLLRRREVLVLHSFFVQEHPYFFPEIEQYRQLLLWGWEMVAQWVTCPWWDSEKERTEKERYTLQFGNIWSKNCYPGKWWAWCCLFKIDYCCSVTNEILWVFADFKADSFDCYLLTFEWIDLESCKHMLSNTHAIRN